jgi:YidC/Oxa1 family membrane protein insertase
MEKRLIIAFALSLVVLLAFQRFQTGRQEVAPVSSGSSQSGREEAPPSRDLTEQGRETSRPEESPAARGVLEEFKEQIRVVETGKYSLFFSNRGGSLRKILLKKYIKNDRKELLFDAEGKKDDLLFEIKSPNFAGLDRRKYELTSEGNTIKYTYTDNDWIEISKKYSFKEQQDHFLLTVQVRNLSDKDISFSYEMTGPGDIGGDNNIAGRNFLEAVSFVNGDYWKEKAVKQPAEKTGQVRWAALKNRYFVMLLKPFQPAESIRLEGLENNLKTSLGSKAIEMAPGELVKIEYVFYAGPIDEEQLAAIDEKAAALEDYGFLSPISRVLLGTLRFYRGIFRNWGVAILFLTLTVNLLLFPLTIKSVTSMQKMKKIQPHLQKLKELHKDNPQKLNKETMELYKKYNINPLGGCLPLLLQFPIFIALYQGLIRSIDLKGAGFLWVKDLSAPDALFTLPFNIPFIGNEFNLLPVLMIGAMFFQQKISQGNMAGGVSSEQQQQQKMMMLFMPLIFGVFFYKMPSGLVLYWLTNTLLMTFEHRFIGKRFS